MSVVASQLIAQVSIQGVEGAIANLLHMGQAADGASNTLKALTVGGIAIAGAALVGIGVKAVQMAGNFQEGITQLATGAGESQKNLKMVSDGMLNMAVTTGTSTDQLSAGMYMIESAGYHGARGLSVLQAAAEGAKVGNADLGVVADGVTTIMTDYAKSHISAAAATNILIATVANGKTHMQDLAGSMANILPTASAVHVGMIDVAGAMSTMTGEAVPAAQASTYLRQLLMALSTPAKAGAAALKSVGLTSTEVATEMKKSLPDALKMITDAVGKKFPEGSQGYLNALKNIAGGSKQMQGILDLTGDHMKAFQGNVGAISDAVKKGGKSIVGWSEVQGDFNFKMDQAKEVVETLMIRIGTALLPAVSKLLTAIMPVISAFSNWITQTNALQNVIAPVTAALSGMADTITGAFGFMQQKATAAMLKTKEVSLSQSQQAAEGTVAHFQSMKEGLENELQHTASAAQRHMIQMQINAVNTSLKQATGVVSNYAKQRAGIEQQLSMVNPVVALRTLEAKQTSIAHSLEQAKGVIANYEMQRAGLENELQHTSSASERHMIEMRIQAVDSSLKQEQGVVKNFETQTKSVTAQVSDMKEKVTAQHDNLLLRIGGFIHGVIGFYNQWKPIILGVAGVIAAFFVPAVINAGVQAVISGAKTAATFIKSIIESGVESWKAVAKIGAWIGSMAASGAGAIKSGAIVTAEWIGTMVKSAAQAVKTAAVETASWASGMAKTAAQAIKSGAIVTAQWIGSMIATAAQAVKTAAITTGTFVVSMAKAAAQAITTGAAFLANLIPAIISFAAESIAAAATAIPAMIVGMIAWAASAWAAAAAMIAATWPVLAIIAAIALLVVGIILLVQHWGQVVSFLQSTWQKFSSWFMNALHAVGTFFANIWNGIVSFIVGIWNTIVNFVREHALLLLAVITGPIGAIVILIVTHWSQIVSFLQNTWQNIISLASNFVHGVITWIVNLHNMAVQWITRLVTEYIVWAESLRAQFIKKIEDLVSAVISKITDFVHGVIQWFINLHNEALAKVHAIADDITGVFKNLIGLATGWGHDLIQNLINGVTSQSGNVKNAISNIAGVIKSVIHFTKPDTGPLVDVDKWMPDMGDLLSRQITAQAPKLQAAMSVMVRPMAQTGSGISAGSASYHFPAMSQSQAPIAVSVNLPDIQLDGMRVSRQLLPHIVSSIRNATGVRI